MTEEERQQLRRRRVIRTDGTEEFIDRPITNFAEIEKMIGCTCTDSTQLRHLGRPVVMMLVDDNGYETEKVVRGNVTELVPARARKPVNAKETELYLANCIPGTTHQIVGDVFIAPDSDFGGY
jgi:hypothetical protein